MDIVANTRTNHWGVLKSKKIFLAFVKLNHFRIKRPLFLLTRKFINDLVKKNSCLFAKCGTQTKLFLVMAHKIRCYYGKRFSLLLLFKICLFVLIFEFPALFVLISWLSSDVENQSDIWVIFLTQFSALLLRALTWLGKQKCRAHKMFPPNLIKS